MLLGWMKGLDWVKPGSGGGIGWDGMEWVKSG